VKHVTGLVDPLVVFTEYRIKNSASFICKLQMIHLKKTEILVSFDMVFLFTEIPSAAIGATLERWDERSELFWYVLTLTYFLLEGKFCEQTDDMAMH
jgi:hypothetical protein